MRAEPISLPGSAREITVRVRVALRRLVLAMLGAGSAVLMVACSLVPGGTTTDVAPALSDLGANLTTIEGVQDAVASSSFDGGPTRRRLEVRLYLDEPAPADLGPVVKEALELESAFDGFKATGYSLQLWNGPRQKMPYDNSKHIDLAPLLPDLDLPNSRVYLKDLYFSRS